MQADLLDVKYMRLSIEDCDAKDNSLKESFSISSQRRCIDDYIKKHKEFGNDFEEFIDDGYSGTNMDRPCMRRLIRLVEEGRIRTIIVRDLSRFSRDYLEAGHFLEYVFPAYGVRFISVNENFDSANLGEDTGGWELAIRNLINHMYSKDISRKIKSAVDIKKYNGEFVYGFAPYGYKKGSIKNTIIIDDEAARVVKQIFTWAAEGLTITQIAQKLNAAHIITPSLYLRPVRGDKYKVREYWSFDSVRNILDNRIYTGDTVPFKSHVVRVGSSRVKQIPEELREIIPNTHQAIISREMYLKAHKVVKSVKKPHKSQASNSPFSSLLVCGCCGNKLQKGRAQNKHWLCATARYTDEYGCNNIRINEKELYDIVLRAINTQRKLLNEKEMQITAINKVCKNDRDLLLAEYKQCQNKLSKIQSGKMSYYEDYASGKITKELFLERKDELTSEEESLKLQMEMLNNKLSKLTDDIKKRQQAVTENTQITKYKDIEKLTPELLKELIKSITVFDNNVINIEWNFYSEIEFGGSSLKTKVS